MDFPVVFRLLGRDVSAHAVLEAAGYTLAGIVFHVLRRRRGDSLDTTHRWLVVAGAAAGAVFGSRITGALERLGEGSTDLRTILGAKSIVGGILGGWIGVEAAKRMADLRARTGDLFAAPLLVGIAVGRVGCFLEGLRDRTTGLPTSLPWGVDFGDGPRHPAQLYETAFCLALLPFALRRAAPGREGSVFRAVVAAYLAWRLAVDFLKPRGPVFGLSAIQWTCVLGLAWIAWERRQDRMRASPR
ncbi:MAG: Prolipoprotein diacylglyceryl transferase [Planctomycetes bacterium]|nr:Prolipoprotein diacylglyceryl transferase [Planctomycetota bacterium]